MPYTDSIGTWRELSVVPITATADWQIFPNAATGKLFRFYFFAEWGKWEVPNGFRSFVYLREHYRDDSGNFENLVTPAFRLYPKTEAILKEIPALETLKDNPYIIRKIGFKKIISRRPHPKQWLYSPDTNGKPPVLDLSLSIEYLVDGT